MFGWWRRRRELKTRVDATQRPWLLSTAIPHIGSPALIPRAVSLTSLWRPDQQDAKLPDGRRFRILIMVGLAKGSVIGARPHRTEP